MQGRLKKEDKPTIVTANTTQGAEVLFITGKPE